VKRNKSKKANTGANLMASRDIARLVAAPKSRQSEIKAGFEVIKFFSD
jgi:hypothetical protein